MADQLKEYETQLADVHELLKASPNDASLLSLESDLLELIKITKQSLGSFEAVLTNTLPNESEATAAPPPQVSQTSATAAGLSSALEAATEAAMSEGHNSSNHAKRKSDYADDDHSVNDHHDDEADQDGNKADDTDGYHATAASPAAHAPAKKKAKKLKEFEVPKHLIPLDTDTETERNRKRRALKAMKSKYREKKKEVESDQKQKSWQSFQKKTKHVKDRSMFATNANDSKVGVVTSGRHLTSFDERKRHTQT